ncbi:sulfate transport system permease protein [Amaricoccus macauensis]|uniref:Sulfate transport system permease protein CysT n=1 Tax=Amaricoccus macauensis TaxID=57001 RepID=A0A840SIC5_9RHOB|nr:sulfate ABC transporter permease subunit CysT [Amaricoccus macauensis]MBB5222779.1 sulfate transport system permease protein [Amaricoccus macauensis]
MSLSSLERRRRVMPGFGLSMGVALTYFALIILLPLVAMAIKTASLGWEQYWKVITAPRSLASYRITVTCALAATVLNAVVGLLFAWVLTRYRFPGRRLLDGLVDLPFALPTAVAGVTLVTLLGPNGWFGSLLEPLGIKVAYTPLGIMAAMFFTSIPFVVRTVQPVLEDVSADVEEAAKSLGARPWQTFALVIWPLIMPAFLAGATMSFARSLGEFGAVVFIAGNLPMQTEITSLLIFIRLDEYSYGAAAALASVLLIAAFLMLFITNSLQAWALRYARRS